MALLIALSFYSLCLFSGSLFALCSCLVLELLDEGPQRLLRVFNEELNEGNGKLTQNFNHTSQRFVEDELSVQMVRACLWGFSAPLDQLRNNRPKLVLIELDHELLECLNHR